MSGTARIFRPSAADTAVVRALAPLSADLMIECGPFKVPVAVIAPEPTLEHQDSEEARITRDFVAADPWHGMGSVYPGGWVLLARDDDTVVIGQRTGEVGVGAVVTLVREGDRFQARGMGGWRVQARSPTEQVEVAGRCTAKVDTVVAQWTCGQNLDGVSDRLPARVELLETPDAVHFLLLSAPNPDFPSPTGWSVGTGRSQTTTFALSARGGTEGRADGDDAGRRTWPRAWLPPPSRVSTSSATGGTAAGKPTRSGAGGAELPPCWPWSASGAANSWTLRWFLTV